MIAIYQTNPTHDLVLMIDCSLPNKSYTSDQVVQVLHVAFQFHLVFPRCVEFLEPIDYTSLCIEKHILEFVISSILLVAKCFLKSWYKYI